MEIMTILLPLGEAAEMAGAHCKVLCLAVVGVGHLLGQVDVAVGDVVGRRSKALEASSQEKEVMEERSAACQRSLAKATCIDTRFTYTYMN